MHKSFKFLIVTIFICALIYAVYFLAIKSDHKNTQDIPSSALVGFDKCSVSDELKQIKNNLIKHGKPSEKMAGVWVYAISGQLMGFPVSHIDIGVCDDSGERNCGWGYYTGFVIDKPIEVVSKILANKYGVDYTIAQRDEESEVTLRPLLSSSTPMINSVLFCDPGSL